jgi:prepilin-type N-terminal cleavage/methylation domain-containing protein
VIEAIQRRLAARSDEEREGGFTLIELMVVVMIIAILVGIAIPAFLGARKRAQDTASKSNLRNALSTAQTIFTDNQAYLPVADAGAVLGMVSVLGSEEPSLTFKANTAASAAAKEISVNTLTSTGGTGLDEIILSSKAASGKCFFLRHVATAGQANLSGSYMASVAGGACAADDAPATGWTAL